MTLSPLRCVGARRRSSRERRSSSASSASRPAPIRTVSFGRDAGRPTGRSSRRPRVAKGPRPPRVLSLYAAGRLPLAAPRALSSRREACRGTCPRTASKSRRGFAGDARAPVRSAARSLRSRPEPTEPSRPWERGSCRGQPMSLMPIISTTVSARGWLRTIRGRGDAWPTASTRRGAARAIRAIGASAVQRRRLDRGRPSPSAQMRRRDEIDEQPDARRHGPAGREGGEEFDAVAPVVGEAFDEASGFKILRHVPERLQREAPALEHPTMEHVGAAAGKMAADLDLLKAALSPEPPVIVEAMAAGEAQTFMGLESIEASPASRAQPSRTARRRRCAGSTRSCAQ